MLKVTRHALKRMRNQLSSPCLARSTARSLSLLRSFAGPFQVWDYMIVGDARRDADIRADIIFVLGSNDLRVAERAADLWRHKSAPLILFSGGFGNFTSVSICQMDGRATRSSKAGAIQCSWARGLSLSP